MREIFQVSRTIFVDSKYVLFFLLVSIGMFWLFLAIPVKSVPGNNFTFQLSLLGVQGFVLLGLLSILTSLSVLFHVYALKHRRSFRTGVSLVGSGGTGFLSGAIATIFGTATCAYCVSAFFGFLGIGGVLFLIQYRMYIVSVAIILMLFSLYLTARRVSHLCNCG